MTTTTTTSKAVNYGLIASVTAIPLVAYASMPARAEASLSISELSDNVTAIQGITGAAVTLAVGVMAFRLGAGVVKKLVSKG